MTRNSAVVSALFLLSLFGALGSGNRILANLTYLWGGLLVVSFIWSRLALRGVRFERDPRTLRSQVGQLFVEHFRLVNDSRVSKLWVEVRDGSDLPGYWGASLLVGRPLRDKSGAPGHRASSISVGLRARQERTWQVRTLCTNRGRFRLGPATLHSGDPFGLFPVTKEMPASHNLVVLPMTVPLRGFPIPSGRLPGGEALRQQTHQVTPNASSVRDYAPGDGFNRIHWPSTVKRQRLIVKEFEFDPMAEVWLVLDASLKPQAFLRGDEGTVPELGGRFPIRLALPPSTEEYGVSAAAALSLHLMQRDRAVGLVAYGSARHVVQADRGESQLHRILESLAVLDARGKVALDEVLKIEGPRIPRGASVIMITPDSGPHILNVVRHFRHVGKAPVLVLLDSASFGGSGDPTSLALMAKRLGIPTFVLRCGEPLDKVLSSSTGRRRFVAIA